MKLEIKNSGFINGELWDLLPVFRDNSKHLNRITVPKFWIDVFCKPDKQGKFYVGYRQINDEIIIKAYKGNS